MKSRIGIGMGLMFIVGLIALTVGSSRAAAAEAVTFEVYDPTGAIEVTNLFAPRVADLNGKTICELSNDSWEAQRTFPAIRELLQRQFPTVKIVPYTEFTHGNRELEGASNIGDVVAKRGCQAVITGNAG